MRVRTGIKAGGSGVINAEGNIAHRQPSWTANDYRMHHHQGDLSVDTWSPPYSQAHAAAIKAAAINGSQVEFDAACVDAVGSWYSDAPNDKPSFRSTLKACIASTP